MKRWGLVIALLLSLGANVGILASIAFGRLRPAIRQATVPAAPEMPQIRRLAERLGLEGEERRRFVRRQRQFFEKAAGLRTDIADINRELRREITRPAPDPERIDLLLGEAAAAFGALEKATVDHVRDTRATLTPEQEKKFVNFVKRLRGGPFAPRWRQRQNAPPNRQPPPGVRTEGSATLP